MLVWIKLIENTWLWNFQRLPTKRKRKNVIIVIWWKSNFFTLQNIQTIFKYSWWRWVAENKELEYTNANNNIEISKPWSYFLSTFVWGEGVYPIFLGEIKRMVWCNKHLIDIKVLLIFNVIFLLESYLMFCSYIYSCI